ncbi:hypothetical protein ACFY93_24405 [Streptomyces sp. NPDC008313]|uniref:hypothetical protein n=1 Tax=Streptomyces sp. NPDC008313 TaxID=3364826 RepID=UPI0036E73E16
MPGRRGRGAILAVLRLSATPGPYDYATVTARTAGVAGVRDLRLGLRGPLRLAHVGFSG